MFQFAFDGALFTLKQKSPAITPLFTLPPAIRATAHTVPYILFKLFVNLLAGRGFSPAPLS